MWTPPQELKQCRFVTGLWFDQVVVSWNSRFVESFKRKHCQQTIDKSLLILNGDWLNHQKAFISQGNHFWRKYFFWLGQQVRALFVIYGIIVRFVVLFKFYEFFCNIMHSVYKQNRISFEENVIYCQKRLKNYKLYLLPGNTFHS